MDLLSIQIDCKKRTESGKRIRSASISNSLGYGGWEGFSTDSIGVEAKSNGKVATGAGSSIQSKTINLQERLVLGVAVPLLSSLLGAEMGVPTNNTGEIL